MAKQSTVRTLTKLAQTKTDAAARQLAALNLEGRQVEEKLALLLRYREDYEAHFREAVRNGVSPVGWDNYQRFMEKLEAAIEQQRMGVAQVRARVTQGEQTWRDERRKRDSYDVLAQRNAKVEAREVARREQREQDEHAAKAHSAKLAGSGN